jgi:hypothetical protein
MITGGGYPVDERRVTPERRRMVLERDAHTCRLCSAYADTIYHVPGSSDDMDNLRALCHDCNRREAFRNATVASEEQRELIQSRFLEIAERVAAGSHVRLCDSSGWQEIWRGVRSERRKLLFPKKDAVTRKPRLPAWIPLSVGGRFWIPIATSFDNGPPPGETVWHPVEDAPMSVEEACRLVATGRLLVKYRQQRGFVMTMCVRAAPLTRAEQAREHRAHRRALGVLRSRGNRSKSSEAHGGDVKHGFPRVVRDP